MRVSYLDELARKIQEETGTTFIIITHNIPSVMRTADYIGVLFRSGLVKFASKEEMVTSDDPIIRQFLAGPGQGPDRHGRAGHRAERHREGAGRPGRPAARGRRASPATRS